MINKEILTISEVKEYLKIGKSTVYDLIQTEQLRAIKIRSCYRVLKDDLIIFINNNKTIC